MPELVRNPLLRGVCVLSQTHTGDYNGAPYPFHCQPIGGEDQPGVSINANGSLESEDPELEVREAS